PLASERPLAGIARTGRRHRRPAAARLSALEPARFIPGPDARGSAEGGAARTMIIAFYISGHGLGHASRAIELMHALASTAPGDRKSTRLNSSHQIISYAVFCLK